MPEMHIDIAIIGGGIAGLWTLNQLRNAGYNAVLFEHGALGSDQTIASQGMIHGGIKYALSGSLSGGSEAIAAMPARWRQCLAGEGKVDLRPCQVLSEDFFLWSSSSLQSRVSSFFASKLLRGRIEKLSASAYPEPFANPGFRGQVYRLQDLVLDVPSLVTTLANAHREAIFSIDWQRDTLAIENGEACLHLPSVTLHPRQLILTAGTGNEALIQKLGGAAPAMQRRPLQQVLVKHQYQAPLYAHCMGGNTSPRLTVSSHRTQRGEPVWYLGGDLATNGTDLPPQDLIARAQSELAQLLPWIDFGECQWRTIKLDRAEPRQSALLKPDEAFVGRVDAASNVLAAWPTKLTLSPNLGDAIESQLATAGITPGPSPDLSPLAGQGHPPVAQPCWDTLFS